MSYPSAGQGPACYAYAMQPSQGRTWCISLSVPLAMQSAFVSLYPVAQLSLLQLSTNYRLGRELKSDGGRKR